MKPNRILEELWRTKDELAREAGDDIHRLCENTRQWAAAHPHPGPRVRNAEELRRLLAETEDSCTTASDLALNDHPCRPAL